MDDAGPCGNWGLAFLYGDKMKLKQVLPLAVLGIGAYWLLRKNGGIVAPSNGGAVVPGGGGTITIPSVPDVPGEQIIWQWQGGGVGSMKPLTRIEEYYGLTRVFMLQSVVYLGGPATRIVVDGADVMPVWGGYPTSVVLYG